MIRISAVIITFNEARNIGRCLDSLASVADDMVVVDSFSTDNTENIATKPVLRLEAAGRVTSKLKSRPPSFGKRILPG